ncbi:Astra associated protein 1 Asa1 [Exophiala xenobiotica]|nr:Astra associated protein 1 Asa1 [Exophiala xenobiotica]
MAVWKGHEGAIMAIRHWTNDRLVSHGRDHKLRVWQVRSQDIAVLDTKLPGDGAHPDQAQPWLSHSMPVNALNFCAFSMCDETPEQHSSDAEASPQLIASPNGLDSGGIDIFQLPSEHRVSQIPSDTTLTTGMVMAVSLFHDSSSRLLLISGYEDGQVIIHSHHEPEVNAKSKWQKLMSSKPHSQPILSLDVSPSREHFITSSADATIAKFTLQLADVPYETRPERTVNTKHAGQQGLNIRSDGKIFATAGWDGRVRVYSAKTMKELAVLQWHKQGCYATDFAAIDPENGDIHAGTGTESDPDISSSQSAEVAPRPTALELIKRQREEKARQTHWLAAGGKDGKISLWDIY